MIKQAESGPRNVRQSGLLGGLLTQLHERSAAFALDEFGWWPHDLAIGFQTIQDVVQSLDGSSPLDPEWHSHCRQSRSVPRANRCVVIAHHAYILRHANPLSFERRHQMDGRGKARSRHCSGTPRPRTDFGCNSHEVQAVEVAFKKQVRGNGNASLLQRVAERGPTPARDFGIRLNSDKGDSPMTDVREIIGLGAESRFIVEANVPLTDHVVPVQRHEREIGRAQIGDKVFVGQVVEHDSVESPFMGQVNKRFSRGLSRRIAVEKQAQSQLFRLLLRAVNDFWIDVSSRVADREDDRPRTAGLQTSGQCIGPVVQRFGCFKDSRSRGIGYTDFRTLNDPRYGRNIDSTVGSDVFKGGHLTQFRRIAARHHQIITLFMPD